MVGLIANEGREDLKNVMNVVRFDPAKVTIGARGGEGRGGANRLPTLSNKDSKIKREGKRS